MPAPTPTIRRFQFFQYLNHWINIDNRAGVARSVWQFMQSEQSIRWCYCGWRQELKLEGEQKIFPFTVRFTTPRKTNTKSSTKTVETSLAAAAASFAALFRNYGILWKDHFRVINLYLVSENLSAYATFACTYSSLSLHTNIPHTSNIIFKTLYNFNSLQRRINKMSFDKKNTSRDALDNKGGRGDGAEGCVLFVWCNCMNIIRIQDVQSVVWLFSILMLPSPLRLRQPLSNHQPPGISATPWYTIHFFIFCCSSFFYIPQFPFNIKKAHK